MDRSKTRHKSDSGAQRARHPWGMITTIRRATQCARVAPASRVAGSSRSVQIDSAARNLAYRRLVAVMLGLDVASLASQLQSARQASTQLSNAA